MNVLLGLASLITILLFGITVGTKMPSGPDRAGLGALYAMLEFPRWLFLAIVLWNLAMRGSFAWISSSRGLQVFAVITAHIVMGAIVLMAIGGANDTNDLNGWGRLGAMLLAFGPTVILIVYLAGLHNPGLGSELPMRALQWTVAASAGLCILLAIGGAIALLKGSMDEAELKVKESRLEQDQQYKARLAELEAIPKDGEMGPYLHFIHNEPGDIPERAIQAMQARPTYVRDLGSLLRNQWKQEAMTYILAKVPKPPEELAPDAAEGVHGLALWTAKQVTSGVSYDDEYGYECRLAVQIAERFPKQAGLFVEPLKEMLAGVSASTDARVARLGKLEVQDWLRQHQKATK